MKANEGTRSQIKKATSIKEVKKLLRTAEEANNRHGYVYACHGYMDKLHTLAHKVMKQLGGGKK
jgi:hypothetical protein